MKTITKNPIVSLEYSKYAKIDIYYLISIWIYILIEKVYYEIVKRTFDILNKSRIIMDKLISHNLLLSYIESEQFLYQNFDYYNARL